MVGQSSTVVKYKSWRVEDWYCPYGLTTIQYAVFKMFEMGYRQTNHVLQIASDCTLSSCFILFANMNPASASLLVDPEYVFQVHAKRELLPQRR